MKRSLAPAALAAILLLTACNGEGRDADTDTDTRTSNSTFDFERPAWETSPEIARPVTSDASAPLPLIIETESSELDGQAEKLGPGVAALKSALAPFENADFSTETDAATARELSSRVSQFQQMLADAPTADAAQVASFAQQLELLHGEVARVGYRILNQETDKLISDINAILSDEVWPVGVQDQLNDIASRAASLKGSISESETQRDLTRMSTAAAEISALETTLSTLKENLLAAPAIKPENWQIVSEQYSETAVDQPFIGNGYIGVRVPSAGTGYWVGKTGNDLSLPWPEPANTPRFSSAMVEGLYATQGTYIATLPYWPTLTISDGIENYDPQTLRPEKISDFRQNLDMQTGTLSTSLVWSTNAGKKVRLEWMMFTHRTRQHLGVVQLKITPLSWTGPMGVQSILDLRGIRRASEITSQRWQDPANLGAQASITASTTGLQSDGCVLHGRTWNSWRSACHQQYERQRLELVV